jgi:hypothetical protein
VRILGWSAAVVVACALLACSGSGGTPQQQIQNRVQAFTTHFNEDDAKAILDDDVPTSFRRTCSDAAAKQALNQVRQFGTKLSVKSVNNIAVNGSKATAQVVFDTGLPIAAQVPALTVPFVHEAGSWRFDTGNAGGCNGILPTSLGTAAGS